MTKAFNYPIAEENQGHLIIEEPVAIFGRVENREQVIRRIKMGLPAVSFEKLRE